MSLYRGQKRALAAWLEATFGKAGTVELDSVVDQAQRRFVGWDAEDLHGMAVSWALRSIGFNRDYTAPKGAPITYARKVA